MSLPVLSRRNYSLQFESAVGVDAVLAQKCRPIAIASSILNASKRNYLSTERKILAVISAFNKLHYCFTELLVKVVTEHSALTR